MVSFLVKNNIPYIGVLYQRNAENQGVSLRFGSPARPWFCCGDTQGGRAGKLWTTLGAGWGVSPLVPVFIIGGAFSGFRPYCSSFLTLLGAIFILAVQRPVATLWVLDIRNDSRINI